MSFNYPRNYILKTGDEPQEMDLAGLGQLKTNYVQPGAVTVAAIELPRSSYPGTDFTSAYFGVSVNSHDVERPVRGLRLSEERASGKRTQLGFQSEDRRNRIRDG